MSDELTPQQQRLAYEAYDAVRRLYLEMQQLKARCKYAGEKFEKVSRWSVGQHIEHVLAVNAKALPMLAGEAGYSSGALPPPAKPETLKLLESGMFLRGEAEAIAAVRPMMTNYVDLAEDVERGMRTIDGLLILYKQIGADDALYAHPSLGGMTRTQWLRYLEIHTRHHLKIIADIVGRNTQRLKSSGVIPRELIRPGASPAQ